ncbi:hypothetical protein K2173_028122 [Erythroxylum novogranatense]|uniref:Uncharacterized protein n=1 Tax=Erythroxylum novogranatense TaxID=1862640 RepID=A0AAV8U143_9ROSI|nr:hypothetical protein K2173_028122 [Erythroxylum novogranatense]
MEEEKAAAYYEELTRKGEGAARFKQGLGFSTGDSAPSRGTALPSASSFLSNFVKASSPTQASKLEKQAQLESIQNKLKKKPRDEALSQRRRSRSRERDNRERHSKRRSRSRSRERYRDRETRRRRRSTSRSSSPRRRHRSERRNRSLSPREHRRSEKTRNGDVKRDRSTKERNGATDYSRLISGYDKMTRAERVKARMKFQLNQTAKDDAANSGPGWERFEFDKDAPLDDEEETEVAEDDVEVVKRLGHSFRFSVIEARREEQLKAAHDEAIFGAPTLPLSIAPDRELETDNNKKDCSQTELANSLLSEKVGFLCLVRGKNVVCKALIKFFLILRYLQNNKALGVIELADHR